MGARQIAVTGGKSHLDFTLGGRVKLVIDLRFDQTGTIVRSCKIPETEIDHQRDPLAVIGVEPEAFRVYLDEVDRAAQSWQDLRSADIHGEVGWQLHANDGARVVLRAGLVAGGKSHHMGAVGHSHGGGLEAGPVVVDQSALTVESILIEEPAGRVRGKQPVDFAPGKGVPLRDDEGAGPRSGVHDPGKGNA